MVSRDRPASEGLEQVGRHPVAGQGQVLLPAGSEEPGAADVGVEDPHQLPDGPPRDFREVQCAAHSLGHGQEGLGLPEPAPGLGVEAGVLDRDGGVIGEPAQHRLLPVREWARRAIVHDEDALHLAAYQNGNCQDRHEAVGPPRRDVAGGAGIFPVRVRPDRASRAEGKPSNPHARLDDHGGEGEVVMPGRVVVRHLPRLGIAERQARGVAPAQLPRGLRHPLQHRREVQRGVDGAGQLGHGLGLPPLALGRLLGPPAVGHLALERLVDGRKPGRAVRRREEVGAQQRRGEEPCHQHGPLVAAALGGEVPRGGEHVQHPPASRHVQ